MNFHYLVEKVANQKIESRPFKHIEIVDFFNQEHFREITSCSEVDLPPAKDDEDLIFQLGALGYECIPFPGTTQNIAEYLSWHSVKKAFCRSNYVNPELCEGLGMTFRLVTPKSGILQELHDFFNSKAFLSCITDRFAIQLEGTYSDNGLQKYLDGYEISPHPDIRQKAITYMININPRQDSESVEFHTHYMRLIDSRKYIKEYWDSNPDVERCWVPWQWCRTEKMQKKNNSFVLFSPGNDTIHAIRAAYDHLAGQRTQFYGNLWYKNFPKLRMSNWKEFIDDTNFAGPPKS
ncbi:MAG TPA: hypothetical protein VFZ27_11090 [Terriglobia bacterium]|nr:hypothetical protein [Terriglobia bacterium]